MSIKAVFSSIFPVPMQSILLVLLGFTLLNTTKAAPILQDQAGNILFCRPECQPQLITPIQPTPPKQPVQYDLYGDTLKQWAPKTFSLTGNTQLLAPNRVVLADRLHFNQAAKLAQAFGHVRLIQPDLLLTADTLTLDQHRQKALFSKALYQLLPSRGYGQAAKIQIDQHRQISILTDASFTTCPLQGGVPIKNGTLYQPQYTHQVAWELHSKQIKLDSKKRRVYGRHTWLSFYGVPIFYTPYFNFSLEDRDSGLLFPHFGVMRSINKDSPIAYWQQPYYFNLAPNYDDTLSLLAMQERGLLLDNEFRYLNRIHQATLTLSGIHDNLVAKEGLLYALSNGQILQGEKQPQRWRAKLEATQHWNAHWQSEINWQKTSDVAFYSDYPIESGLTTATDVERHAKLHYSENFFKGQLDGSLTVSDHLRLRKDAPYNYERKPSLTLNYAQLLTPHTQGNLLADITEFQLSHPALNRPEGIRQALQPTLHYRLAKPYGYLEPQLKLNALQYQLENQQDPDPIFVPQYALKGGLTFERTLNWQDTPLTQTLVPELQWLYVPYIDQQQNPLFDTQPLSLNFSNLYALNRFSGFDRIGDTHQLTATLTSEIYNRTHSHQFKVALGQIFYFTDRKVTLNNTPPETAPLSDYYTQLSYFTPFWQLSNTSQWQRDTAALDASNTRLQLQLPPKLTLLLSNQAANLTRPSQKTESLSGGLLWQPLDQWRFGIYQQYNFTDNLKTDNEYAVQYNNCCWSAELSLHEQQLQNGVYNYGFKLVVEFKGLSTLGTPFNKRLQQKLNF